MKLTVDLDQTLVGEQGWEESVTDILKREIESAIRAEVRKLLKDKAKEIKRLAEGAVRAAMNKDVIDRAVVDVAAKLRAQ